MLKFVSYPLIICVYFWYSKRWISNLYPIVIVFAFKMVRIETFPTRSAVFYVLNRYGLRHDISRQGISLTSATECNHSDCNTWNSNNFWWYGTSLFTPFIFIFVQFKEYNIQLYILMQCYLICSLKGIDMPWLKLN
jgi:hypothetical protein